MGPERIYERSAGPRVQGLSVERDPVAPAALSDAARLRARAEPRETRHDMHPRGPDGHAPQLFGEVGGSGAAWLAAASQRSHPWPAAPAGSVLRSTGSVLRSTGSSVNGAALRTTERAVPEALLRERSGQHRSVIRSVIWQKSSVLRPRSRVPDLFAARTVPIPGGAPPASGPAGCGAQTNPAPPRRAPRRRSAANPPSLRPYISFLGRAP